MRVLAAPDKMRGTLTARQFGEQVAAAAHQSGWTCTVLPLADGGEGTVDALGGANRHTTVTGPLGEPVQAAWRLDGALAVIEMAAASGLALTGGNDPVRATTRGTGQLIAAAIGAGATRVIVGVGGSATVDGGLGALQALAAVGRLDGSNGVSVEVACDVTTRFVAAAAEFGPQKGADEKTVAVLEHRLATLAADYRSRYGVDVSNLPGAGAAGGLAGGLAALGARLCSGFDLIAAEVGLTDAIGEHDLVITGEGALDTSSFAGKVVGGVAALARMADVECLAIVGRSRVATDLLRVVDLTERFGAAEAISDPSRCIRSVVGELLA